ncbi:hypothetical protein SISNIDRAFT_452630 [Sistotremastrum niveocremeum HHB9708]|uniref:Uncharacterized protein n=1 Tax=Sistotremastrum niveocremeum HHB9708 TaxID=1314777 RepID=A0A164WQW8_9AGAM|nr:hypothetical protein SISNIDRAFT_452630 [Sistotremastrum niveocremeum HHB9708]
MASGMILSSNRLYLQSLLPGMHAKHPALRSIERSKRRKKKILAQHSNSDGPILKLSHGAYQRPVAPSGLGILILLGATEALRLSALEPQTWHLF